MTKSLNTSLYYPDRDLEESIKSTLDKEVAEHRRRRANRPDPTQKKRRKRLNTFPVASSNRQNKVPAFIPRFVYEIENDHFHSKPVDESRIEKLITWFDKIKLSKRFSNILRYQELIINLKK
tara:strand:- start:1921 stop:2286 length:366 start_codon:yes stop_codon:yes gene_type:complete